MYLVWMLLGIKIGSINCSSFSKWWSKITDSAAALREEDISLICCLLWFIWKQRNGKVFNQETPNTVGVIEMASKFNAEFWTANKASLCPPEPENMLELMCCWTFPPVEFLKINCDGASFTGAEYGAIKIICRDSLCNFKWGFVDKVKSVSAFMTEALALKRALTLAIDLGNEKIIFATDCKLLQQSVESKQPTLHEWKCRGIIQDIINLLATKVGFSLIFTPRKGNMVADLLATDAYKGVCPVGWVSCQSLSLSLVLTSDAEYADEMAIYDSSSPLNMGVG